MSGSLTIEEMLELTADGEERLFKAPIQGAKEERFAAIQFNSDYIFPLEWNEGIDPLEAPCMATRRRKSISLSVLPEPQICSTSKISQMVDFYRQGIGIFFVSNRLMDVMEKLDPGSVECRPVVVQAADGAVDYNLVLPLRQLDAVDLERTDVLISGEWWNSSWLKRERFPHNVVFKKAELEGIHNFNDITIRNWFWSRELIDAAKAAGVKGPRFRLPGNNIIVDFERL